MLNTDILFQEIVNKAIQEYENYISDILSSNEKILAMWGILAPQPN